MGLAEIDKALAAPAKTGLAAIDADLAPKAPEPKAKRPDSHGVLTGAVLDTLGVSGRPGAKSTADVILRPKDLSEVITREAALAPLTVASLPIRIGTHAGLGAIERLTAGKGLEEAGYAALIDGAVAGITEGALGYIGSKASKIAKPWLDVVKDSETAKRAFAWATRAPQEAISALASRLPSGQWMNVPSLSGAKLTVKEAIDELVKLTGAEYKQARAEIASELSRLDKQRVTGPKPVAGTVFAQRTSPERFVPPPTPTGTATQRGAARVADVATSPLTRAAADTLTTIPVDDESGLAAGGIPILGAIKGSGEAWHWLKRAALH